MSLCTLHYILQYEEDFGGDPRSDHYATGVRYLEYLNVPINMAPVVNIKYYTILCVCPKACI